MVLFVHGFSNKVIALQFEWAWQHPTQSRFLKGGALAGLRVGKRSFAAATLLKVLAPLMACDEFAREPLGVHILRGALTPTSGALAAVGDDRRLEGVLAAAIERQEWRAPPRTTHGCPVAAGVLPAKRSKRGVAGPCRAAEDDDNDENDEGWELALLHDDGSSSSGADDSTDERAMACVLRCPDESSDDEEDEGSDEDEDCDARMCAVSPAIGRDEDNGGAPWWRPTGALPTAGIVDLTVDSEDDDAGIDGGCNGAGGSAAQGLGASPPACVDAAHDGVREVEAFMIMSLSGSGSASDDEVVPLAQRLAQRRQDVNRL